MGVWKHFARECTAIANCAEKHETNSCWCKSRPGPWDNYVSNLRRFLVLDCSWYPRLLGYTSQDDWRRLSENTVARDSSEEKISTSSIIYHLRWEKVTKRWDIRFVQISVRFQFILIIAIEEISLIHFDATSHHHQHSRLKKTKQWTNSISRIIYQPSNENSKNSLHLHVSRFKENIYLFYDIYLWICNKKGRQKGKY